MTTETQVVKKAETPVADLVLSRVTELNGNGGLDLPANYSAANALKGAMMIINEMTDDKGLPVIQSVTRDSIINSLFKMATLGLNPSKRQCSFIKYGKTLVMQREYAGSIALAKRYGKLAEINGNVVYEGEEPIFKTDPRTGRKSLVEHNIKMDSIDTNKIKGAYAVMVFEDGTSDVEIMSMAQIRKSWEQGAAKGKSPAHTNFPDQMAIKTVISRACKLLIASSDDSVLMQNDNGLPMEPSKQIEEPVQYATEVEPEVIDIPEQPQPEAPKADPLKAQGGREWKKPEVTPAPEKAPF